MNMEQQLLQIIEEYVFFEGITSADAMFINGCIEFYKKCGNRMVYQKIAAYTENRLSAEGRDLVRIGNSLRFLWEETMDERYKNAIDKIISDTANTNRNDGVLVHEDGTRYTAMEMYELIPIYAWHETHFNKKENYINIMKQLRDWNDQMLIQNTIGFYDRCTFMMALAETLVNMSEEIYEYYAQIQMWLKDAVHKILHVIDTEWLRVAYSILKGCETKALLPEKYEYLGKEMFEKAADQLLTNPVEDKEELGILLMTYALI